MKALLGQVAIVTGAGRGIGRAIALTFARAGVDVSLASRTQEEIESVAEEARALGSRALPLPTDVAEEDQVEALVVRSLEDFGKVDILVNCAGIALYAPVVDYPTTEFDRILATNLRGVFLCSRAVLKGMYARGSGTIINIASIAGKVGTANRAAYCASKFGVLGFSEALAQEARRHNVRVSVICPGSVRTTFGRHLDGGGSDKLSWALDPEEVARAALHLAASPPETFISEVVMRPTNPPRS